MKKLLTLMLVLGLASTANAQIIQLSYNGVTDGPGNVTAVTVNYTVDPAFTIDVHSDTANYNYDMWVSVTGPASGFTLANTKIYGLNWGGKAPDGGDAGDNAVVTDVGRPDHLWVQAADSGVPFNVTPGTHFEWAMQCTGEGLVTVVLKDFTTEQVYDTIEITQIPEPATMLLLGLGGLFLRLRK